MSYCKLTNQDMTTYNGFQWKLGVWYSIDRHVRGKMALCSRSWFHCYNSPLLAVLLNPIHADIRNPRLFAVSVKGKRLCSHGLKFGFTYMRLDNELEVPRISLEQRVRFGILCAKVYTDTTWNEWADNWLSGKDRTRAAAYAAEAASAVDYAAEAASAAASAAYPAYAAYAAAYAAVSAAVSAGKGIDLVSIARQSVGG